MKKIVSGSDMKKVDNYTINDIGIPSIVLMERAALSVADFICQNEKRDCTVLVVAGTGNNGADGLAVCRMLYLKGYCTCLYILGDTDKAGKEFQIQLDIIKNLGIEIARDYVEADIIVDALFGVGLSRDVQGNHAEIINRINKGRNKVYAVDIPSGIDADSGKVCKTAVKADYTVTFGSHKIGTVLYPGADYCGKVVVADIGFPQESYDRAANALEYAAKEDLKSLPYRPNYSNKGTYGKVLIIAGSKDISGAAYLCAAAAFRVGAGLVRVFTAKENREVIQRLIPEVMVNTYDTDKFDKKALEACLKWSDVVAVGPGLSTGVLQKIIVEEVLKEQLPTVIDADGINNIAEDERLKRKLHKNVIITPHLGEASRLMNVSVKEIASDLIKYAKRINYKYNVNCILKDARTVIATEDKMYINLTGNSGMATAGSGDVLTGITAGLLAIGVDLDNTCVMAPFIHGLAGDLAVQKTSKAGLMASDMIAELKGIFR